MKRFLKKVLKILILTVFIISVFMITGFIYWLYTSPLPDIKKLEKFNPSVASYVYANNGEEINKFFYTIRDPVTYEEIPELIKQAFLSAEDKRFFVYGFNLLPSFVPYSHKLHISIKGGHWGVDPLAILRAALDNWENKRVVSGASTITQQLVGLFYGEEIPEFKKRPKTIWVKAKEAQIAFWVDYYQPKEKIFETFCNLIYLGHGRFGIKEAAKYYFSKELKDLNPAEVAVVAALNKYPRKFCPIDEPERAKERRNWVLGRMRENGFLTDKEFEKWKIAPLEVKVSSINDQRKEFGYASDYVRTFLLDKKFSVEDIWYYGGLQIFTTIDSEIQRIVNRILDSHLENLNSRVGKKQLLQGAVVVVENKTGRILAISGGKNFLESEFNRATNRTALRQPGSAFKPIVYAAALLKGFKIDDIICDCPFVAPDKIDFYGRVLKWWRPRNYEQKTLPPFMGQIKMWKGMALSRNLATINLARKTGISEIIQLAHQMGIENKLDPYLPTAIGSSAITVMELTTAYTVFANGGKYVEPYIIEKITSRKGKNWERARGEDKTILSQEVADDMIVLLRSVVLYGTAKMAKDLKQPIAGKTGTTNDFKDAWFMGFTPSYTIGVWIGYDIPQKIGEKLSGAIVALPVFVDIVNGIYEDRNIEYFSEEIEQKTNNLIAGK